MPGLNEWSCVGTGPAHPADLENVATPHRSASSETAIERCRTCGQLYLHSTKEISDWSADNDYSQVTDIWTAIDPDEAESISRDSNYRPRGGETHRHETGWRRD